MSPTSDYVKRLEIALDYAVAAGVPSVEVNRWRRSLDPKHYDLCGCRAGIVAFMLTCAFGLLFQIFAGFNLGRVALCLIAAIVMAVIAKVVLSACSRARFNKELALLFETSEKYALRKPARGDVV